MEDKRNVYVVSIQRQDDDMTTSLKVFSSLLKAKNYCEEHARDLYFNSNSIDPEEHETLWEDKFTYVVKVKGKEWMFEIEEVELDEDVADVTRPDIEVENESLRKENLELKDRLSKQMSLNAAAHCFAVMWDGGWKYTKEHVIKNLHAIRSILEGNEDSNAELEKMFEAWMKNKMKMS